MTHQIDLQNDSSAFFKYENVFQTVFIRNNKHTYPNDSHAIVINLIYSPFCTQFKTPIAPVISSQSSELNILQIAKNFDKPFDNALNQLDIQLEMDFKSKSAVVSFGLEFG